MKPSYEELEAQTKQLKIDADCYKKGMEASNARLVQLAAENAGLNEKMNKLATWPGIEFYSSAWEFNNGDGNDALEFMCDVQTPATYSFLAEVRAQAQSEVIEWLDAEITAIDTMYRGDPSYEHDAYWMKSNVLDVVELARKAFAAQIRKGVQS